MSQPAAGRIRYVGRLTEHLGIVLGLLFTAAGLTVDHYADDGGTRTSCRNRSPLRLGLS